MSDLLDYIDVEGRKFAIHKDERGFVVSLDENDTFTEIGEPLEKQPSAQDVRALVRRHDHETATKQIGVTDLERLEFQGLRLKNGKLQALGGLTFDDWPQYLYVVGVKFRCVEKDDDDHYLPADAPKGSTGSMAWYEPD